MSHFNPHIEDTADVPCCIIPYHMSSQSDLTFVFIYCHLSMHQTRHFSNHLPPVFDWNICCSSIFGNSSQNVLSQKALAMLKMTQGPLNVKKILSIL